MHRPDHEAYIHINYHPGLSVIRYQIYGEDMHFSSAIARTEGPSYCSDLASSFPVDPCSQICPVFDDEGLL